MESFIMVALSVQVLPFLALFLINYPFDPAQCEDNHAHKRKQRMIGRLGAGKLRPCYPINDLAFSPDGRTLAIANGILSLWDTSTGDQKRKRHEFEKQMAAEGVAYSPDGRLLAVAAFDHGVTIREVKTGRERVAVQRQMYRGDNAMADFSRVRFSRDGKLFACSHPKGIAVRDVSNRKLVRLFKGYGNIEAFTPDHRFLVISHSKEGTVSIYDLKTGAEVKTFKVDKGLLTAALSPDGVILACSSNRIVATWELSSGRQLARWTAFNEFASGCPLTFSPDAKTLAAGNSDGTVQIWDPKTGRKLKNFLGQHREAVIAVAFSPDGKLLASASADTTLALWKTDTGKPIVVEPENESGHRGSVTCLQYSSDGKSIVSGGSDGRAIVWNLAKKMSVLNVHSGKENVAAVSFSPDNSTIAVATWDGLTAWEISSRKKLFTTVAQGMYRSVAYSPNGKLLAAGTGVASKPRSAVLTGAVELRNAATGKLIRTMEGHSTPAVVAVSFSSDGTRLASVSQDEFRSGPSMEGALRVWDIESGKQIAALGKGSVKTFGLPIARKAMFMSGIYCRDGKTVETWGSDRKLRIWNLADKSEARSYHIPLQTKIMRQDYGAWSSDGKYFVVCDTQPGETHVISLWSVVSGKMIAKAEIPGTWCVTALALSPRGQTCATGLHDGTVLLWQLK